MAKKFLRTYGFLLIMLLAIVAGCITGGLWQNTYDAEGALVSGASLLKPLGTVFINLMFCIVVPMVLSSIAGAVAGMGSRRRAGRIMAVTVVVFVVTGAIAAVIMYGLMRLFPPVLQPWQELSDGQMGAYASLAELLVNFFTAEDFVALLSRKAMLPLIVFSILFGFAVNVQGGRDSLVAQWLRGLSDVMMRLVKIVTYYAPIAFFGFFADLVATYGPMITADYGRAMLAYYPLCLVYALVAFPLFAWLGGGGEGVRRLLRHILRPAMVSLGTCSSIATIPTNMEAAEATGISPEVSDLVLPLGATMHMDGSCFSCVLKVAFLFGVFGRPFGWDMLVPVVLVAVLSSVGMSGVPGGGYIGEYIICSIFFPEQMAMAFPILVTIGNLVDPPATMVNSAGDYAVSFVVERFVNGKDWLKNRLER